MASKVEIIEEDEHVKCDKITETPDLYSNDRKTAFEFSRFRK